MNSEKKSNPFLESILAQHGLEAWSCAGCGCDISADDPHIAVSRETILCHSCFNEFKKTLDEDSIFVEIGEEIFSEYDPAGSCEAPEGQQQPLNLNGEEDGEN